MAVVSNTCNGTWGEDCKVYLEYKINSQDVVNNKSNITLHLYAQATSTNVGAYNFNNNCKAYIKIDGVTKKSSTTLNMDFRNKKKVDMLTWTGDVTHGTDGKLTLTISGNFDTNGPSSVTTGSVSKVWTLTTIPRASSVTCADGNIGSSTTINISRASSSFTHTITYSFGGLTGTIATKTSETSIGWSIPTSFYEKIPSATSGKVTITCQTYSGNTLIGTKTTTANVFVVNSEPDISAIVVDTNVNAIEATGDLNKLIRYISNVQVTITATAKNSASISSVKVISGSKSATATESILNEIDSGTFEISCVDSRKLSSSQIIEKEIVEYIKPVITDCVLERENTTSNTVNVNIQGQFFNGNFGVYDNTLELKYRYKVSGTDSWSEYIMLNANVNENSFTYSAILGSVFNYNVAYDFEFVVEDIFISTTHICNLTRGIPIIDIGENDVKLNEQAFLKDNKVLCFVLQNQESGEGYFVDVDGNKYLPEAMNQVEDTGWIEATLGSGVTANSNALGGFAGIRYRRIGNHVYVNGSVNATWTSGTLVLTNLPTGFIPKQANYKFTPLSGYRIGRLVLFNNGNLCIEWVINVSNGSTYTGSSWFQVNMDFFID